MPRSGAVIVSSKRKKNYLINGGFDLFQRGGTTSSGNVYIPDRWRIDNTQSNTTSRQTAGAPLGSIFYSQTAFALNGAMQFFQALEDFWVNELKTKQVTFSFLLRRSSDFVGDIEVRVQKNATPNSSIGGSWSNIDTLTIDNADIPERTPAQEDWVRFSKTITVPNDGSANGLRFNFTTGSLQPVGAILEIAQCMANKGPDPAPFELAGRNLAEELALCQRYFEKSYDVNTAPGTPTTIINTGFAFNITGSAATADPQIFFITEKRTVPNMVGYNPNSGAIGTARLNTGADASLTVGFSNSIHSPGSKVFVAVVVGVGGSSSGGFHWTADAEI